MSRDLPKFMTVKFLRLILSRFHSLSLALVCFAYGALKQIEQNSTYVLHNISLCVRLCCPSI